MYLCGVGRWSPGSWLGYGSTARQENVHDGVWGDPETRANGPEDWSQAEGKTGARLKGRREAEGKLQTPGE
jgi:hypothetical protein